VANPGNKISSRRIELTMLVVPAPQPLTKVAVVIPTGCSLWKLNACVGVAPSILHDTRCT
jgi:hypothetical protein